MKIYQAWFENHKNVNGIELELKNGNLMSVIHDGVGYGGDYVFWGGKIPRPYWMGKDVKRERSLIFNTDFADEYVSIFESMAMVARKLAGVDTDVWPWWGEVSNVMRRMKFLENDGANLWKEKVNDSSAIFETFMPMHGKDESLTKLVVACGFGFSGEIITTSGEDAISVT